MKMILPLVIRNVLGLICVLLGIPLLFVAPISGGVFILLGLFILPKFYQKFEEKLNYKFNRTHRYVIAFSLLILGFVTIPDNKSSPQEQTLTPEEHRRQLIEKQFSTWDGSHPAVVAYTKKYMNDPKSFEHIETTYIDQNGDVTVYMKFRGANAFGGKVINSVTATVDLSGNILEIKSNQ